MVQVIKQGGEKRYRESFGRYYEEFTVGVLRSDRECSALFVGSLQRAA